MTDERVRSYAFAVRYSPDHKARNHENILSVAARSFRENGGDSSGIGTVMKKVGLTKGGFYRHFKSKDDLFVAVLEHQIQGQFAAVEALLAEHPLPVEEDYAVMRAVLTPRYEVNWTVLYLEFVVYALRNPSAMAKLAAYRRRTRDAVERMVQRSWASQDFEAELSARSVATITLALFGGIDLDRIVDPEDLPTRITDDALTFVVAAARGLGEDV